MKKEVAAIAAAVPLALMLTAGPAMASSYAAPAEEWSPEQDQYQKGVNLACVTLLGPSASPSELQARAQSVLAEDPNDPNGLDADGDGTPCEFDETLDGEVAFEDGSGYVTDVAAPPANPAPEGSDFAGDELACVILLGPEAGPEELRQEAQAVYDADPADPHDLDADGNGLACEFSVDPAGEVLFEDGSGFAIDPAQHREAPVEEVSESEVSYRPPASAPVATVIDEAAAKKLSGSPGAPSTQAKRPALRELPATGGVPVLPISGGPATAGGTALVGTALLLAAKRRPPGV